MNCGRPLIAAVFSACIVNTSPVLAQITQPAPLELNSIKEAALDENSRILKDIARYDCYAINTTAGQQTTISLESSAFDPVIEVARGALCHASTLQYENDNANDSTTTAQVSFEAAGGRYLVLVKSKSPQAVGQYRLKIGDDAGQQIAQEAPTNEEERRKKIMAIENARREAEIAKRKAVEIAAAEEKRKAEQAAFEASLLTLPVDDYEDYSPPRPQQNIFTVFAETLNSELAKQQQAEQDFQQGLNQAIRQGEAQRQHRLATEQAAEARRVAALQKSQEAEQARREAEEAQRRAAEQLRMVSSATGTNVMRNPGSSVTAKPVAGSQPTAAKSSGKASTKSDPQLCISQPQQMRNPNCKDGTAFRVTNSCEGPVDIRICIRLIDGQWDCGLSWGVKPGASFSSPSCRGTSDVFVAARHSDSDIPLASPP